MEPNMCTKDRYYVSIKCIMRTLAIGNTRWIKSFEAAFTKDGNSF